MWDSCLDAFFRHLQGFFSILGGRDPMVDVDFFSDESHGFLEAVEMC